MEKQSFESNILVYKIIVRILLLKHVSRNCVKKFLIFSCYCAKILHVFV